MNLRWLIFDYVDTELKLPRADRRVVRHRAIRLAKPGALGLALLLGIVLPLFAFYTWGVVHYSGRFVNAVWPEGGLLLRLVIVYLAIWIVLAWIGRRVYRPAVWRALHERGYDICLQCGYSLRGLSDDTDRCPECGTMRETTASAT